MSSSVDVIALPGFEKSSKKLFSSQEREALMDYIAFSPDAGDVIPGTGGIRKLRWAAKGKGKRGGARIIYFHYVNAETVFLLFAYAKNDQEDLNQKQKTLFKEIILEIIKGGDRYG